MKSKFLSENEKRKILMLHREGHSYHFIAGSVNRSTKAVEHVVRQFKVDTPSAFNFPEYLRKPWPINV